MLTDSSYFFSTVNPIANVDQRFIEETALKVFALPHVQSVWERCKVYWRKALEPDWDRPTQAMFDEAMIEYAYNYILKAACSDASHPRIAEIFLPAHDAFGPSIPGSRIGGPNPDNIYRVIGIEHGAAYELHGIVKDDAPANVIYSLVTNYGTSDTVAALETPDLVREPDGSFVITIDADPAGSRCNHLQTQPGTVFLFIRDTFNDWTKQIATPLRIRRITTPCADPLTLEEIGRRAAKSMFDMLPLYYWYQRTCQNPVNNMEQPSFGAQSGGPLSQAGTSGGVRVGPDEAVVCTVDPGGATYHSIVVHDMCFRTISPDRKTSSFNNAQGRPGADGNVTYVFARQDPGVANWVDMGGLPRVIAIQRWQLIPAGERRLGVTMSVAKLSDLDRILPDETASMTTRQREAQIVQRQAAYQRRLTV